MSLEYSEATSIHKPDPEEVAALQKVLNEGGMFEGRQMVDYDVRFDPPKRQVYYLAPFVLAELVHALSQEYCQTS